MNGVNQYKRKERVMEPTKVMKLVTHTDPVKLKEFLETIINRLHEHQIVGHSEHGELERLLNETIWEELND